MAQLVTAVESLHLHGFMHRDLKLGNIIVQPSGIIKIIDFELSKVRDLTENPIPSINLLYSPPFFYLFQWSFSTFPILVEFRSNSGRRLLLSDATCPYYIYSSAQSKVCIEHPGDVMLRSYFRRTCNEFRDHEHAGTSAYMAPEIGEHKPYGRAVDWWSVGVIFYKLLTGEHPLIHNFLSLSLSVPLKCVSAWKKIFPHIFMYI